MQNRLYSLILPHPLVLATAKLLAFANGMLGNRKEVEAGELLCASTSSCASTATTSAITALPCTERELRGPAAPSPQQIASQPPAL